MIRAAYTRRIQDLEGAAYEVHHFYIVDPDSPENFLTVAGPAGARVPLLLTSVPVPLDAEPPVRLLKPGGRGRKPPRGL
jgi:hypothetical protein